MAPKGSLFVIVLLMLFGTGGNPKGEKVERDVKVCEGATVTLVCGTDGHKASYRWRFASMEQVPKKTDKYEQLQNGTTLLVKNVDHSDVKKIRFISCSIYGDDMRITYLYKIVINCENFHTPVGSSVRLSCKVDVPDDELDYIRWTLIDKRQSKTERIMLFKKNGKATAASSLKFNGRLSVQNKTLQIQNITMEDVGAYHCVAYRKKNFQLSNPRYYYNVNVTTRTTTKPNISTGSMQDSTTSTTIPKDSTQSSVVQTNSRSTPRPTSSSLPNKKFTPKTKELLPTTSGTENLNETQKHPDRTQNGSSRTFSSKWLFVLLMFNLANHLNLIKLDYIHVL